MKGERSALHSIDDMLVGHNERSVLVISKLIDEKKSGAGARRTTGCNGVYANSCEEQVFSE